MSQCGLEIVSLSRDFSTQDCLFLGKLGSVGVEYSIRMVNACFINEIWV